MTARGAPAPPRIVRVGRTDVARVVAAAELFDGPPDPGATRAYLADHRNVLLLAYRGGRAVGMLRGTGFGQVETPRPQFLLYEVSVAPDHRRRGVGAALVRCLLDHCRKHGFAEVFVFTDDPRNRAARRLYRSTGALTETVGDRMYVYRLPMPTRQSGRPVTVRRPSSGSAGKP